MNNERDTEAILREVKVEFGSDEFKTRAARLETWEKIEAGMERQADRRRLVRRLVRATASVAAAAVAGIGVFLLFGTEPELVTVANRTGEPMEVVLEEGTRVWLHDGAQIAYPERFSKKQRPVTLEGEAFFDVTSEASRPFRVATAHVTIEVLGTEFNVMADPNAPTTEVMLESGSVALSLPGMAQVVKISPGELAMISHTDSSITVSESDPYLHSAWMEDEFIFRSQPLSHIARVLGKAFDVEIDIRNDKLAKMLYTGRFKRDLGIEEILLTINMNTPMNFTFVEEDRIVIK